MYSVSLQNFMSCPKGQAHFNKADNDTNSKNNSNKDTDFICFNLNMKIKADKNSHILIHSSFLKLASAELESVSTT